MATFAWAGLKGLTARNRLGIPAHMNESMNKFLRANRELEKELGRAPTNDEISRRMDISVEKVQKLKTISR